MLKKFTTGLLALTLMTGMTGTITSFADDLEGTEATSTTIEKSRDDKNGKFNIFKEKSDRPEKDVKVNVNKKNMTEEKREAKKAEGQAQREEKHEAKKIERQVKRDEILNNMYPEIVETYTALRTDLETSKDEVKSIKNQIDVATGVDKEANKAEHIAFMESLKTKLEAEEITREEAKELFAEYREAQKAAHEDIFNMSDENKAKLEEIKTQFKSFKKERKVISKDLKEALSNEDIAAFKVAFDKSITILESTLSLANQKIEVLTDILSNL